jgi:site-specific recombinase
MFKFYYRIKNAINPGIHQADLVTLLRGLSPTQLNSERIDSFEGLIDWLRLPVSNPEQKSRNIRFKFLIQFLERNPDETKHLIDFMRDFTKRGMAIRLLSLTGVSENHHFFDEIKERLFHKIIPLSSFEYDLAEIFQVVFTEVEDAEWIEENYEIIIPPILKLMGDGGIQREDLLCDLKDAMLIVTAQIASIGTNKEIRRRPKTSNLADSHFIKISKTDDVLFEIMHCRDHLSGLKLSLEVTGVSVDLIYQIEKLEALLNRLESLFLLQNNQIEGTQTHMVARFIGGLIRDEIHLTGLREFLNAHLQLITRKVVEHAGEQGDYFIANNAAERSSLLKASAWAGVLTAFAALFKVMIEKFNFPYLVEGFFFFLNYAVIFLSMQKWHLALASKLPAYTASALSKQFEIFKNSKKIANIINEIRKIFHSQMIATIGNLVFALAVSIIIDWGYFFATGQHIFSQDKAFYIIKKFNLLTSGTILYAAFTGVLLWFSSILAGVTENWLVFINFSNIIKESPFFNRLMSRKALDEFAHKLPATLGSTVGNLSIAAMLATPIVIANITGLPIDVRHVTLSSGAIAFAFNTLNWDLALWPSMISMAMSIVVMGIMNFGVSFFLATKLAAISQGIENRHLKNIFKLVLLKPKIEN